MFTYVTAVALVVAVPTVAAAATVLLNAVPPREGGALADVVNVGLVLASLPGAVVLLLAGPFVPRGLRRSVLSWAPEPSVRSAGDDSREFDVPTAD